MHVFVFRRPARLRSALFAALLLCLCLAGCAGKDTSEVEPLGTYPDPLVMRGDPSPVGPDAPMYFGRFHPYW